MNWLMMDMNSYFASAEQFLRPELRGRPVAVIPVETDFTSAIAASREAKLAGVKTGTPVREARRLCPGIRFVKARPKLYVHLHHRLLGCVDRQAPVHKVYSIDEWTVALRGADRDPVRATGLAERIKDEVRREFGPCLTSSIGIAPTRLLAKIGSNLHKPDGLTCLPVSDLPGRLDGWSLSDLPGIADGMSARLERAGVRTVRQLWELDKPETVRIWNSIEGERWWNGFHGIDEPEIPTRKRTMTHGHVLAPEYRPAVAARGVLVRLVSRLGCRLRTEGYVANQLTLSLQRPDGARYAETLGLSNVDDTPTLLCVFDRLWNRVPPGGLFKKVEVTVGRLVRASQVPKSLFAEDERPRELSRVIDEAAARHGPNTLYFGSMHDTRWEMDDKIAFGRIPPLG